MAVTAGSSPLAVVKQRPGVSCRQRFHPSSLLSGAQRSFGTDCASGIGRGAQFLPCCLPRRRSRHRNFHLEKPNIMPPPVIGGHLEPAELIKQTLPMYPARARTARVEGMVVLEGTCKCGWQNRKHSRHKRTPVAF